MVTRPILFLYICILGFSENGIVLASKAYSCDGLWESVSVEKLRNEAKTRISQGRRDRDLALFVGSQTLLLKIGSGSNPVSLMYLGNTYPERVISKDTVLEIKRLRRLLIEHQAESPKAARLAVGSANGANFVLMMVPREDGTKHHFIYHSPRIPCSSAAMAALRLREAKVHEIVDPGSSRRHWHLAVKNLKEKEVLHFNPKNNDAADYLYWAASGLFHNDNFHFVIPENLILARIPKQSAPADLVRLREGTTDQKIRYIGEITRQQLWYYNSDPQYEIKMMKWLKDKTIAPRLAWRIFQYYLEMNGTHLYTAIYHMPSEARYRILKYWLNNSRFGKQILNYPGLHIAMAQGNSKLIARVGERFSMEWKIQELLSSRPRAINSHLLQILQLEPKGTETEVALFNFLMELSNESFKGRGNLGQLAVNFLHNDSNFFDRRSLITSPGLPRVISGVASGPSHVRSLFLRQLSRRVREELLRSLSHYRIAS